MLHFLIKLTLCRNLDATELRCAGLVSLIQRIDADVDIEAALGEIISNRGVDIEESAERSQTLALDLENNALSDRLEWNESSLTSPSGAQHVPLDGMASLPSRRAESGYLGEYLRPTLGQNVLSEFRQHFRIQYSENDLRLDSTEQSKISRWSPRTTLTSRNQFDRKPISASKPCRYCHHQ